ncbi:MAG: phosphohydrolase, partial [Draconibacterium sp.]
KLNIENLQISKILDIIEQVSFKGAGVETKANSLEAKIVQDADRLDAIGAIGIARTFAFGGNKGRLIYHPEITPELHQSFAEYKKTTAPTINHFYEKLLLLKNRLNTKTAFAIAENRHTFMEDFLTRFFAEWEGNM